MSDEKLTRIGRYQTAWNRTDLEKEISTEDPGDPKKISALRALGKRLKIGEIEEENQDPIKKLTQ